MKTLPAVFRRAARLHANGGFAPLSDDEVGLWLSFRGDEGCTDKEAVLGLLLLAEILETAE